MGENERGAGAGRALGAAGERPKRAHGESKQGFPGAGAGSGPLLPALDGFTNTPVQHTSVI